VVGERPRETGRFGNRESGRSKQFKVLKERYLDKNAEGETIEKRRMSWFGEYLLQSRVQKHDSGASVEEITETAKDLFYKLLNSKKFLPNRRHFDECRLKSVVSTLPIHRRACCLCYLPVIFPRPSMI